MTPEAAELKERLEQLSPSDREELAAFLWETLDDVDAIAEDDEFLQELERRSSDLASGADPGEDYRDVLAELRRRLA